MKKKPSSFKSTSSPSENDTMHNNHVLSKLRRLKIEENLLLQSIQKLDRKRNHDVTVGIIESETSQDMDYKNMIKNLKGSYIGIKNLFDEVKIVTCSRELLAELELEELKAKVFELETTLKSFKARINTEMNSLKSAEQELTTQMEEINVKAHNVLRKRSKLPSSNYNQVVPSPVRLMMTSPFKCVEVQDFQNFMKNSLNRYGGWNEYHHNIFVKYWQKYFGNSIDTHCNSTPDEYLSFENFVEETSFKLQDISRESFMCHVKWYQEYLFFKNKQQQAIDKWKSNRRSMRKIPEKILMKNPEQEISAIGHEDSGEGDDYNQIACDFIDISKNEKCKRNAHNSRESHGLEMNKNTPRLTKPLRKTIGPCDIERLMKPTKQSLSRNYDDKQRILQNNFIENLEKLRVPTWRQYL